MVLLLSVSMILTETRILGPLELILTSTPVQIREQVSVTNEKTQCKELIAHPMLISVSTQLAVPSMITRVLLKSASLQLKQTRLNGPTLMLLYTQTQDQKETMSVTNQHQKTQNSELLVTMPMNRLNASVMDSIAVPLQVMLLLLQVLLVSASMLLTKTWLLGPLVQMMQQ